MNTIHEGKSIEKSGGDGDKPSPARVDLESQIERDSALKDAGILVVPEGVSERGDLRAALVAEQAPGATRATVSLSEGIADKWASLDAAAFGRESDPKKLELALAAVADNARANPDYASALENKSPALADAAKHVNESIAQIEAKRAADLAAVEASNNDARMAARLAIQDAAAMAYVERVRQAETAAVAAELRAQNRPFDQADLDNAQEKVTPRVEAAAKASAMPEFDRESVQASERAALKRPVLESELPESLRDKFIVTAEGKGLFDKGRTEFSVKEGREQGMLAFSDAGKELASPRQDKATVEAMVTLAAAKNWKEITVEGSDEFKRQAWLAARAQGMEVHGYEPREADKVVLAEALRAAAASKENHIREGGKEIAGTVPSDSKASGLGATVSPVQGKHIDGDSLSAAEQSTLKTIREDMERRKFDPVVTSEVLKGIETDLRKERAYVGEVVNHGEAPYKFQKENNDSYFVTLKTDQGEVTLWGKGLAEPMKHPDMGIGSEIALRNTGQREVEVKEKVFDADGQQVGLRAKTAVLNEWDGQPLSKMAEADVDKAKAQQGLEPTVNASELAMVDIRSRPPDVETVKVDVQVEAQVQVQEHER